MRIAFILPSLANKGPILVVKDLSDYLIENGCYCKIFYFDDIVEVSMMCDVQQISFWQKIDFEEYDIVHSHMYRPDAYVFLNKPLRSVKTKFFTTVHQHLKEQMSYDFSRVKRVFVVYSWLQYLRRFDAIITLSDYHQEYYEKKHGLSNTFVIHNGRNVNTCLDINISDKERLNAFKAEFKVIGAIAYFTARKGYEQLIRALKFLPDYGVLFVGDGPEIEQLKYLSEEIGVSKQCLWLGARIEGHRFLRYIDIFAMCSRTEGFPLALIEAAAYGRPTLCSNIPIFTSIIDDQKVCFFYLDDIDSLINAVNDLELNGERYSLNINRYYNCFLTAKVMAENYFTLYRKIINSI